MLNYVPHDVVREDRADGSILLRSRLQLGPVAKNTGEWLHQWAQKSPTAVSLAERSGQGWREVRYAELLDQVRAIASSLLARGLGPETPIAIISGNSVDHGILALAAQYVGVPIVPLAEQYSLVSDAHPRLQYAIETVRPAMIFCGRRSRLRGCPRARLHGGHREGRGPQWLRRGDHLFRSAQGRRQRECRGGVRDYRPGHSCKDHLYFWLDCEPQRRSDDARYAVC